MNTKEKLKNIYAEVLGKSELNENENIFDLGGNSASVYKISAVLKEKYELEIKPIDIMMYPTIEKLAEYLESGASKSISETDEVTIRRRSRRRTNE